MATTAQKDEPAAAAPAAVEAAAESRLRRAVTALDDVVAAFGHDLGGLGGWAEAGPLLGRHTQLRDALAELKAAADQK